MRNITEVLDGLLVKASVSETCSVSIIDLEVMSLNPDGVDLGMLGTVVYR